MLQTSDGRLWLSDREAPKSVGLRYLFDLEEPQQTTSRGEIIPTIPEIDELVWSTYGKDGVRFGQYTPFKRHIRMDTYGPMGTLPPGAALQLPPHTRDVEFMFSAPVQQRPGGVTFKMRLVGTSDRWIQMPVPGNDKAIFRNLGPGTYRFEVVAKVTNSLEEGPAATLAFEILPAFYQTTWFAWLCAVSALAALALMFRMQLRRAAGRLREKLEARMSERERIARELHDTLLQGVQGLIMKINAASLQMREHEPARETLDQALDAAEQVLVEGRDRVASLRESGNFERDLTNDIASIGERLAEDHSIAFRASVHGVTRPLHPLVQEEAFLIVREALHNAFRHAGARHITTNVFFDRQALRIEVSDDGRGISKEVLAGGRMGHWGLAGMRERARRIRGALEFKSDAEHGTQVELRVRAAVAYKSHALKLPWLSLRTSDDAQPLDRRAREKMD
jgi:signal transduction histidine kinase